MQRSKRLRVRLVAGGLSLFLVGLCWLCFHQTSLLDRSTVVPGSEHAAFYRWRSNSEILLFPYFHGSSTATPLVMLNTTTGERKSLSASEAFPKPTNLNPNYLDGYSSPDGKQLLWIGKTNTAVKQAGYNSFTVHALNGPQQSQWTIYGKRGVYDNDSAVIWLPDSRRWVEWTTQAFPRGPFLQFIRTARLHDLAAPDKDRTLSVPSKTSTLIGCTPDGHLVSGMFSRNLNRTYAEVTLAISSLEGDGRATQHNTIKIPERASMRDLMLSPQGDRMLWWLQKEPLKLGAVVQKLSHNRLGSVRTPLTDSLWVSRLDGREMHEIGSQRGVQGQGGWPQQLAWVQWRPDGRHISFYYKDAIYTAPTD